MEWILTRDTKLAQTTSPKAAGILFAKAGFKRIQRYNNKTKRQGRYVEARAANLSEAEVRGLIVFKQAGAIVPAPIKTPLGIGGNALDEPKPTYAELVETVEHLTRLVEEIRQENCQLRQHIASAATNGMGDRARKALRGAKATLSMFKE